MKWFARHHEASVPASPAVHDVSASERHAEQLRRERERRTAAFEAQQREIDALMEVVLARARVMRQGNDHPRPRSQHG